MFVCSRCSESTRGVPQITPIVATTTSFFCCQLPLREDGMLTRIIASHEQRNLPLCSTLTGAPSRCFSPLACSGEASLPLPVQHGHSEIYRSPLPSRLYLPAAFVLSPVQVMHHCRYQFNRSATLARESTGPQQFRVNACHFTRMMPMSSIGL